MHAVNTDVTDEFLFRLIIYACVACEINVPSFVLLGHMIKC